MKMLGKEKNVTAAILVLYRKGLACTVILRTNPVAHLQSLTDRLRSTGRQAPNPMVIVLR
jgi:hypothetical protein